MQKPKKPTTEKERLSELESLNVLDTEGDERLDALVKLASEIADTPVALISLVDSQRQWFKSKVGVDEEETHRDISFCGHAININDGIFEIKDATKDERFNDNPLVVDNPSIRFYAGKPLKTKNGHNIGTLCVIDKVPRELTDLQKSQMTIIANEIMYCIEDKKNISDLRSDINSKSAFVASMSHELRTPLTSVIGFIDVLSDIVAESPLDIEEAKKNLSILRSSSEHLVDLIGDILDFSKLEANKFMLNKETFTLNKVLKQVYNTLEIQAQNYDVDFKIQQSMAVPEYIYGDATLLKQVLINLGSNAIKFSNGESVTINVDVSETQNNLLKIDFIDTGIGMTEEEANRVFRPFVQANKNIAKKFDGTGLGLAISREIIDLLGGNIELVKSEKNVGTHFCVDIPFIEKQEEELEVHPIQENIEPLNNLAGKKILIVDDVKENRFLLRHYLKDFDITFRDAVDGKDALKKISDEQEYIFLDMQLPDINGIELFKEIQPRLKAHQKVIAFTASSTADGIQKCMDIGFSGYLAKPFNTESILESVANSSRS